jgi:DNA-binding NarL/FixJ family response regulator
MIRQWKVEAAYADDEGQVLPSNVILGLDSNDEQLPFTLSCTGAAVYISREELYGVVVAAIRALADTDGVSPPEVLRTVVAVLMVDGSGVGNSTSHQP